MVRKGFIPYARKDQAPTTDTVNRVLQQRPHCQHLYLLEVHPQAHFCMLMHQTDAAASQGGEGQRVALIGQLVPERQNPPQ